MLSEVGDRQPPERPGRPVRSSVDLSTVTHDQVLTPSRDDFHDYFLTARRHHPGRHHRAGRVDGPGRPSLLDRVHGWGPRRHALARGATAPTISTVSARHLNRGLSWLRRAGRRRVRLQLAGGPATGAPESLRAAGAPSKISMPS